MRGVKEEYRALDYMFGHESESGRWSEVIRASYEKAQVSNSSLAELARRRYRAGEHRYKTCRQLYISEAQYYKMLRKFLVIAKAAADKLMA